MRPAFIWSPTYEMSIGRHVFPTQKFRLVRELLVAQGLVREDEVELAPKASDAELLAVLTPEYLADLRGYRHTDRTRRSELPITREIVDAMAHTAGGTLLCVRRALERGAACHFGGGYHHGFADHAEGFCYINDVAVAVAVARREGLVQRVAIIDVDTHQGNGTATIFADEPDVYTVSLHDDSIYPRQKARSDYDVGFPPAPGAEAYLEELDRALHAALAHRPELLVYVAGVDPFEDDQLGRLRLSREALGARDRLVIGAAAARRIPFVTVVAGGYARRLEDTVDLHAQTVAVAIELASARAAAALPPRPA